MPDSYINSIQGPSLVYQSKVLFVVYRFDSDGPKCGPFREIVMSPPSAYLGTSKVTLLPARSECFKKIHHLHPFILLGLHFLPINLHCSISSRRFPTRPCSTRIGPEYSSSTMGWSKGSEAPKTIVVLEWKNSQWTASRPPRFWTLDCSSTDNRTQTLPAPVAVRDRIDEACRTSGWESQPHLPPLLTYDRSSHSVLMQNLMVDDHANVEVIRWGHGLHLTQMQAMESLFRDTPRVPSGAEYLSPAGAILSNSGYPNGDHGSCHGLLTAAAMEDENEIVTIKYRAKRLRRNSELPLDIEEAYSTHEQTLRTALKPATSSLTQPHQRSNMPVHMCWVGRAMRYLVLMTLGQNKDKGKSLLSLYKMQENLAFSEACSMERPNQDRGFRWQVQTFELPLEVSGVAPVVVDVGSTSYLWIFYFHKGLLHYAAMTYAGSGSFVDFVDKTLCVPDTTQTSSSPPLAQGTASRSHFSLSSRLSIFSQETNAGPTKEESSKERQDGSIPLAAEGCQPYAVITNGYVWVFYEGAEMNGTYVRRKLTGPFADMHRGWEVASWPADTPTEPNGAPRHFIPVVVPGSFMSMY
ncbi:hypothetical protein B0T10DRAFT_498856 [Thelonectria olida]|uniref:Uncharacterized protein n=1 Tax=Thelonectria olida TaxID=1576542 RepID=A0A9P9AII3_9HYPO|nr:hypothetical protein B0T10DRAFT_498856 [Thelonectria olida]